jgi:hypothetical protein
MNKRINLYKFRSSKQFGFAMDIIMHQRLYCSSWQNLNDILEGNGLPDFQKFESGQISYNELYAQTKRLRVCSLSASYESHLLWAHYADGLKGLAIEVSVPAEHAIEVLCLPDIDEGFPEIDDPVELARERLRRKLKCWKYEKEYRIIQLEPRFYDVQVQSVIVGGRMEEALFKALYLVCAAHQIPVYGTGISSAGISIEKVNQNRVPID